MTGSDSVDVTVGPHPSDGSKKQAVVQDNVSKRAWSGEGPTESAATTEAVRRFLGDRRAREYLG